MVSPPPLEDEPELQQLTAERDTPRSVLRDPDDEHCGRIEQLNALANPGHRMTARSVIEPD
jgi:hypothetical protein